MIIDRKTMKVTSLGRRALLAALGWCEMPVSALERLCQFPPTTIHHMLKTRKRNPTLYEIDQIDQELLKLTGNTWMGWASKLAKMMGGKE